VQQPYLQSPVLSHGWGEVGHCPVVARAKLLTFTVYGSRASIGNRMMTGTGFCAWKHDDHARQASQQAHLTAVLGSSLSEYLFGLGLEIKHAVIETRIRQTVTASFMSTYGCLSRIPRPAHGTSFPTRRIGSKSPAAPAMNHRWLQTSKDGYSAGEP